MPNQPKKRGKFSSEFVVVQAWLLVVGVLLAIIALMISHEVGYYLAGILVAAVLVILPLAAFWSGVLHERKKMK